MRMILIAALELACCLLFGCASPSQADNGSFAAPEFIAVVEVAKPAPKIEPTPDQISINDIMPAKPTPPVIEPPAQAKAAPQMKCSNGQCYPVRRGLFGWRR